MNVLRIIIPVLGIDHKFFLASAFIVFGKIVSGKQISSKWHLLIVSILIVFVATLIMPMSMLEIPVWGSLPYFIVAIFGTYSVYFISTKIAVLNTKIRDMLLFVGNNTLAILTWHMLSFKIVSLIVILIEDRPIEQLSCFPVIPQSFETHNFYTHWWLLYFLAGLIVPLLLVRVKYLLIQKNNESN